MYEINISLNGCHLFATHERSLTNENMFKHALVIFKEKFPESEGYQISAYLLQPRTSKILDINEF